jgi:type I restriction enzyme, S subunit
MSVELLLQEFDRLTNAPDAVAQLRRFVYGLAVRGRLVASDGRDAPASELVHQLHVARHSSAAIPQSQVNPPRQIGISGALPFAVPAHWTWVSLSEVGLLSGGMTPSKDRPEFWDGDISWFSPKDIKADTLTDSELKVTAAGATATGLQVYPVGCLFIVARSGILKRTLPVGINRVPATANQDMKVLRPFVSGLERYLQVMFKGMTDYVIAELVKTGTTVQSLKYDEFEHLPVPFPPIAEQHRIVAKVDELMTLCDQLETTQDERATRADALRGASLQWLVANHGDGVSTEEGVHFFLDRSSRFITKPEHVGTIRQAILDLAVQGHLVLQDPRDEPASKLLDRICGGCISPVVGFKHPRLRSGWETTTIEQIASTVTSGSRGWAEYYSSTGAKFIRAQNIRFGRLLLDDLAHVTLPPKIEGMRTRVGRGDVLIVITGAGVTNPALVDVGLSAYP